MIATANAIKNYINYNFGQANDPELNAVHLAKCGHWVRHEDIIFHEASNNGALDMDGNSFSTQPQNGEGTLHFV